MPSKLLLSTLGGEAWREHLNVFADACRQLHRNTRRGPSQIQLTDIARISDTLHANNGPNADIQFTRNPKLASEAYSIEIRAGTIDVAAADLVGLTRATATLLQWIGSHPDGSLTTVEIHDAPATGYRSLMIDMGRNPHSVELIKETLDFLWFYKFSSLHLHLTDDQRIAWPSRAFPKLWDGRISLEEFRDLESYARLRGITIIPELEVPGHSAFLRQQYPQVFGKTSTDLATSDKAFEGITTLLDEMMDVFSSPYIHIGGDEAYGVPERSQRDLINRLHQYLKDKGRQTLVWEGPGPGSDAGPGSDKVHPDVIHLNWRTVNYPPDRMLGDGYRIVNAAWDPLYIVDHYPRNNFTATTPQHIYETLSLTRFAHVNPQIRTFAAPITTEPDDRLLGFCMPWWEGRERNFFDLCFPRAIAMAEIAWSGGPRRRNYERFQQRAEKTERLRREIFYPVTISTSPAVVTADGVFHDSVTVTLHSNGDREQPVIRYTTDGSPPDANSTLYRAPFLLGHSATVRAAAFRSGTQIGHDTRKNLTLIKPVSHLALGKPVTSSAPSASPFSIARLTDGDTSNTAFYLGFPTVPDPIDIEVDLGSIHPVQEVALHAYTVSGSYEQYQVAVSADGQRYKQVGQQMQKPPTSQSVVRHRFATQNARYIRVRTYGNKGHVFDSFSKLTEIEVR